MNVHFFQLIFPSNYIKLFSLKLWVRGERQKQFQSYVRDDEVNSRSLTRRRFRMLSADIYSAWPILLWRIIGLLLALNHWTAAATPSEAARAAARSVYRRNWYPIHRWGYDIMRQIEKIDLLMVRLVIYWVLLTGMEKSLTIDQRKYRSAIQIECVKEEYKK